MYTWCEFGTFKISSCTEIFLYNYVDTELAILLSMQDQNQSEAQNQNEPAKHGQLEDLLLPPDFANSEPVMEYPYHQPPQLMDTLYQSPSQQQQPSPPSVNIGMKVSYMCIM